MRAQRTHIQRDDWLYLAGFGSATCEQCNITRRGTIRKLDELRMNTQQLAGPVLQGIRIVDFTQTWAGPHCTRLLAELGAEVIKVESTHRLDELRGGVSVADSSSNNRRDGNTNEPWNTTGAFHVLNRGKLSVTFDLGNARGRSLALRLIEKSYIIIENSQIGFMYYLGLGYEVVSQAHPSIIYVTILPFGSTGPERDYVAYGVTQELLAGMHSINSYPGGDPLKSGINQWDPITAIHTFDAVMTALVHRERTGQGSYIEVAHIESMVELLGEFLLDYQINGSLPERMGNRDRNWAPQGCYPDHDDLDGILAA